MARVVKFWLYRCGCYIVTTNHRRFMFGETWLTEDDEVSRAHTIADILDLASRYKRDRFDHPAWNFTQAKVFAECLRPELFLAAPLDLRPSSAFQHLNLNAPEAAFRLQRVGVSGNPPFGRVSVPILSDSFFSDLPHRRHIVNTVPAPTWRSGLFDSDEHIYHGYNRTYFNVIFHRADDTWDLVLDRRLLVNPVRVWQRWRPYPVVPFENPSAHWVPGEGVPCVP